MIDGGREAKNEDLLAKHLTGGPGESSLLGDPNGRVTESSDRAEDAAGMTGEPAGEAILEPTGSDRPR